MGLAHYLSPRRGSLDAVVSKLRISGARKRVLFVTGLLARNAGSDVSFRGASSPRTRLKYLYLYLYLSMIYIYIYIYVYVYIYIYAYMHI